MANGLALFDFLTSEIWIEWRFIWIISLWVEGIKLHVNLPRFRRENVVPPKHRGTIAAQTNVPLKMWKEKTHPCDRPKGGEGVKDNDEWN